MKTAKTKAGSGLAVTSKPREKGEHHSSYRQRRAWLEMHAEELAGMTHKQIVKRMKAAGLLSPSTYANDVVLPPEWKIKTDEIEAAKEAEMEEMMRRPVQ